MVGPARAENARGVRRPLKTQQELDPKHRRFEEVQRTTKTLLHNDLAAYSRIPCIQDRTINPKPFGANPIRPMLWKHEH